MNSKEKAGYDLGVQLFQAATLLALRSGVSKFFLEGELKDIEARYQRESLNTLRLEKHCTCPEGHPEIIQSDCPIHWETYRRNNCICMGGRTKDCLFHGGNNCLCLVTNGIRQPNGANNCPEHQYKTITVNYWFEKSVRAFIDKLNKENPYPEDIIGNIG